DPSLENAATGLPAESAMSPRTPVPGAVPRQQSITPPGGASCAAAGPAAPPAPPRPTPPPPPAPPRPPAGRTRSAPPGWDRVAGVQQALPIRIFAHHSCRPVARNPVLAIGQPRPALPVVVGAIQIRLIVSEQVAIDRVVCRALSMRRRVDERHASARRQILR